MPLTWSLVQAGIVMFMPCALSELAKHINVRIMSSRNGSATPDAFYRGYDDTDMVVTSSQCRTVNRIMAQMSSYYSSHGVDQPLEL